MPAVEGKVAIVTGASSGIGEAIVKELVSAGMIVAGLARRVERVEALAKSLAGKKGKLSAIKCDITSEQDIKKAFAVVEKNLGPLTVLVNNAGVLKPKLITQMTVEEMQLQANTNFIGLVTCAKEAFNSMIAHKTEGTIININSVAGQMDLPMPGVGVYSGTKHAVTAVTHALRSEATLLKANIRVTSLSPGAVKSEMTDGFFEENKGAAAQLDMLPNEDIADCVLYVLRAPQRMTISELTVHHTTESILNMACAAAKIVGDMKG